MNSKGREKSVDFSLLIFFGAFGPSHHPKTSLQPGVHSFRAIRKVVNTIKMSRPWSEVPLWRLSGQEGILQS